MQSRVTAVTRLVLKGAFYMNVAVIKKNDIANGPGVRVSLFVSGCRHHCKGCFNREAWDFNFGTPFTNQTEQEILAALQPDYIAGLSLLGGEPFEPENQPQLLKLVQRCKAAFPQKSIWCYTGFDFERELLPGRVGAPAVCLALLKGLDVLVDGKFVEAKKDPSLLFRGSANQRILDVRASLKQGAAVWLPGSWSRKMGSGNIED